jgi:hypothetical protein
VSTKVEKNHWNFPSTHHNKEKVFDSTGHKGV